MLAQYELLLEQGVQRCAELPAVAEYLSERHLQAMWLEQKYFKALITLDGQPIEVISPGIWNAEAGPDFLKAHIKIDGKEYFGDVELHLRAESWMQHGHHQDSRYDNVILHVVFWKSDALVQTSTNRKIPQTHFEDHLTISAARIVQLIDLDLYPYKKFIGSGRCAQVLFRTLPEQEIVHFFRSAASWRLFQKRQYLKAHMEHPQFFLGGGIAMALGYKNNAEPFLELFSALLKYRNADEQHLLALAMKACGFFSDLYRKRWDGSSKYHELFTLVQNDARPLPQLQLVLNQIRPLNHPIRRMVVLVKMLCDPALEHYFQKMEESWLLHWPQLGKKQAYKQLCSHLYDLLPSYTDSYWNSHYTFEKEAREEFLPLMGENLKNEILINTFLPLLQERILARANPQELEAFNTFYGMIPASDTGKTRYLIHRYFGDTSKGDLINRADVEQGAYQLHRDFCLHYEASCVGCPFVERYKDLKVTR